MPSHGVIPAISSLRGAVGYFEHGLAGSGRQADVQANEPADERQALLQRPPASEAATASKPHASNSGGGSRGLPAAANGRIHTFGIADGPPSSTANLSNGTHSPGPLDQQQQQQGVECNAPSSSGSKQTAYESLDYELIENTVYRTDAAADTHLDHITRSGVKWTICLALGIVTAAAAFAVNFGVENIAGFKFWATLTLLQRGRAFAAYLVYAAINCSLIVGSVALTVLLAPAAAGSGIAEVKAYLNGIDVPGIFFFKTLVVKLTGSVGAVAGGLAVGKEGPFVHAGACLGALLSQGGSSRRHFPWFKCFWNDRDRADFVACGTAAGVAAAFRSPVGGVLFALEEMTSWFRNQLLWYAFFTTAVVSVAVRALMRVCQGSHGKRGTCGFFGSGGYLLYEITEGQDAFDIMELLPVLLLGVIGGLLGACFTYLNEKLAAWRKAALLSYGPRGRLWEGLAAALLTSTASFLLPLMAACQACPSEGSEVCPRIDNAHGGNFVNFACPGTGQYNDLATIFFNTQDDAIRNLFSAQTKSEYSVSSLLAFSSMFFLLAVISYGVALPTGLFVPSILCGAAYGRLVGVFVADLWPLTGSISIDEGTYALLGAASFLGGCMRMTVATCVMLLELTNNLALLPLMMLVTLVAKAVGDGTGIKPIYESLMDLKGLPFLEPDPHGLSHHITAAEAAGSPAVAFSRVERVGAILDVLRCTQHNGFAVIERSLDGEQHIMGIVLRSQLVVLLRSRRCFQPTSFVSEVAGRVAFSYQGIEFVRPISEPPADLRGLQLSEQELAMYLDLGPYANPSYYVVQEDTSLSKVYTLFRSLGLRHLAVIPRASSVVGVITRHDLLPEALEEAFVGQHAPLGAGAAGLATALRGTVRQALDAYQTRAAHRHAHHVRHSSSSGGNLGPLRIALGAGPASAAATPRHQRLLWTQTAPAAPSLSTVYSDPAAVAGGAATGAVAGEGASFRNTGQQLVKPRPLSAASSRLSNASPNGAGAEQQLPLSGRRSRSQAGGPETREHMQGPPAPAAPLATSSAAAASSTFAGLLQRSSSNSGSSWSDFEAVGDDVGGSSSRSVQQRSLLQLQQQPRQQQPL